MFQFHSHQDKITNEIFSIINKDVEHDYIIQLTILRQLIKIDENLINIH